MEWLLPLFLGGLALVYVCMPLWVGSSPQKQAMGDHRWHSVEQLELDRELGKIDDAEFEEFKPQEVVVPTARQISLESLIFGARRQKRLNASLETEVLIARARKK